MSSEQTLNVHTETSAEKISGEQTSNLLENAIVEDTQTVSEDLTKSVVQKKKRTQKSTQVVTDEIRKKVSDALKEMSERVVKRTVEQKPAEILIRDNLKHIDKMTKDGATLAQIFEQINKVFKLNISVASFGIYLRRIRIEMKSELAPKKRVKKEQTQNELLTNNINNGFACEHCEHEATRHESKNKPGAFFWKCSKCNTFYADKNGVMTNSKLNAKKSNANSVVQE